MQVPNNIINPNENKQNIINVNIAINNVGLGLKKNEELNSEDLPMKNSLIPSELIKIPSFEWKQDINKGTKTIEHYLNIYYKKKQLISNEIKNTITNTKQNKEESDINVDGLPFNFKEHSLSLDDKEQITQILKKQIIFQNVSQEILSIIESEMIRLVIPQGKIIYDLNDEGDFFYIISKGKVVVNVQNSMNNILNPWNIFGEISLFTEKKREEVIITKEKTELYIIEGESFRDIRKRNNEMILKVRFNFLNHIFLFECLDKISKYNVAQKMRKKEFLPNTKIITQGEKGDSLYIIQEGIVSCRIGPKEIRRLSNNEYFGQNSMLIDIKRGADIVTLQKTICYELTRQDLKEALTNDYIDVILFCFFRNAVDKNNNLKNILIESRLHSLFNCFTIQQYTKNEHICNPKKKLTSKMKSLNKKLVLVIEGSLFNENSLVADKSKFLGEELFNDMDNTISENIYANPDAITLEANFYNIAKILKMDLEKDRKQSVTILKSINKLKKIYLFRNLSDKTLELIAKGMVKQEFQENEYIINEGTVGDLFYLILKGRVRITVKGKFIRDLDSGDYMGEYALLTENELRTASAMALEKVTCYVLSKKEFQVILKDNTTREYLMKKLALQNTEVNLNSLHYIKFLGKGKFGTVSLVHNKKYFYAIKAISRLSVEREKILAKYFVDEKRIMLSLDHPFIVKMVKSMKNQHFCFLLIEFVNGNNLDQYLSNRQYRQNKYETQFYVGSILLMLDYLQKKYIAHRDIKPSNIMIDSNGYLKMIDFGTSKVLSLTDYTSTVIGTPHYIAPEILHGKGYSLSCDFWSLGICMYEIFYGKYPFGNFANEVIEIYKDILRKDYSYPSESKKVANVNSFIDCLLNKKVNERICNVSKLKKMPFFEGFEFDKLIEFRLKPPFKPNIQSFKKYLKEDNPYSNYVKDDNANKKKRIENEDNEIPLDYDPNWADEF
jgi:cGMP-dependent protein kinase